MAWWTNPQWIAAVGTASATLILALGYGLPLLWRVLRRPRLRITFGKGGPWTRLIPIVGDPSVQWGLFVRVYVCNQGQTAARLVKGRLEAIQTRTGQTDPTMDAIDLHWVGTPKVARPDGILLLPKQGEYLDLFFIQDESKRSIATATHFFYNAQDPTPRGLPASAMFEGQRMIVRVAGENASAVGIELQLPEGTIGNAETEGFSFRYLHGGDIPQAWQQ